MVGEHFQIYSVQITGECIFETARTLEAGDTMKQQQHKNYIVIKLKLKTVSSWKTTNPKQKGLFSFSIPSSVSLLMH